jgi:hypothetical protein
MKTKKPDLFETLANITRPDKWYDKVDEVKPLKHLKPLLTPADFKPLPHRHGSTWDSCEICDKEIKEGKEVWIDDSGQTVICHICQECFDDPDYQEFISRKQVKQIKNY